MSSAGLSQTPNLLVARKPPRQTSPKELLALGIREYREVFFKPYRIIYRVVTRPFASC